MNKKLIGLALILAFGHAQAQQTITFPSPDSLKVTADLYMADAQYPYILLLHQARYSRGEYREIAPKLTRLGYNCLAIDQRSGQEVNFVKNETAALANEKNLPTSYLDALPDIRAAIDYIKSKSNKPIIIWGSSYSASLALVVANTELRIGAVVAFSPGEYFPNRHYVQENTSKITVPVFVASAKNECETTRSTCAKINQNLLTIFCPTQEGAHGSSALWNINPSNRNYWLALTMFFSKL